MNISSSMSSSFQTQRPSGSPPPKPTGEGLTERLDADKNGSLSAAEIEESRLGEMIGDRFGEVDTDGDGALSTAELDAELKANAPTEGRDAREAGGPPPPCGSKTTAVNGTGTDIASLFDSLLSTVETEGSDTDASEVAQALYTQMQQILTSAKAA